MKRGLRWIVAVVLVVLAVIGPGHWEVRAQEVAALRAAQVFLEWGTGNCSGVVVRPVLVMSASHCVPSVGRPITVIFPAFVGKQMTGTVIWDSPGARELDGTLDLAFVLLPEPWPYVLPISAVDPVIGETVRHISSPKALPLLEQPATLLDPVVVYDQIRGIYGTAAVAQIRTNLGDVYFWSIPQMLLGMSGSPFFGSDGIVGIVTHGIRGIEGLGLGATRARLARALEHLEVNGAMRAGNGGQVYLGKGASGGVSEGVPGIPDIYWVR